uniref:Uncharacterized protein n=1 Tax=Arundo donax TaxID=35708 RepID=A0A0A9B3A0_ARUDO
MDLRCITAPMAPCFSIFCNFLLPMIHFC